MHLEMYSQLLRCGHSAAITPVVFTSGYLKIKSYIYIYFVLALNIICTDPVMSLVFLQTRYIPPSPYRFPRPRPPPSRVVTAEAMISLMVWCFSNKQLQQPVGLVSSAHSNGISLKSPGAPVGVISLPVDAPSPAGMNIIKWPISVPPGFHKFVNHSLPPICHRMLIRSAHHPPSPEEAPLLSSVLICNIWVFID